MQCTLKRLPWTAAACLASALLTACGGSSSPKPTSPATCTVPLQYAMVQANSGKAINPQAVTDDWTYANNICNLVSASSARLTVCVDHPNINELQLELRLAGNSLGQRAVSQGTPVGSSCLANSSNTTSLRTFAFDLPNNAAGDMSYKGPWSVTITDTVDNNQQGHFVAWSLEMQGLQ